jgi:hypothetical protein
MNGSPHDSVTQPAWFTSDFVGSQARAASISVPSLLSQPSTFIVSFCTDANRGQVLAMAQHCELLIAALGEVPQGVSHLDAFSRNVTQRDDEVVLFDWALVGSAPVGADLAGLFLLSVFHFDVEEGDWRAFEDAVFEGYRVGLGEVGCPLVADELRFAFSAALALRWLGFLADALPAFENAPEVLEAVTGHPINELLERLKQFADFVRPQVAAAIDFVAR